MPDSSDGVHYLPIVMYEAVSSDESDSKEFGMYLFINEEAVNELVAEANEEGPGKITWEYVEEDKAAENTQQAYILHVVDQDNNPVGEVTVNFCTDTACVPQESDGVGLITFTGAPDAYHVQIIDVPDGYSWDEEYEMYTPREYGEWVLRIRKD